jgi:putative transposase
MCRCLNVSRSGFYAWQRRGPSHRARANARLLERIREKHEDSDQVMGAPGIRDALCYDGERCGVNRVARLMRQSGLHGIPAKKRWRSKPSGQRPIGIDNELERDFLAEAPNTKWVTDITYLRTAEGWLYLAVVLDLWQGLIVGWSMSHRQDSHLVLQAVLMALWQREDNAPVILHSDRGTQFTSAEYQQFLAGHNLVCSMSAVGSCADNAAAEGFFGMLKRERVNRRRYLTRAEARTDVFDYIERFYNPRIRRRLRLQEQQQEQSLTQPSVETG